MKYLLDTSVVNELLINKSNLRIADFVDSLDQDDVYLSSITIGEIARGIEKIPDSYRKQNLKKWLNEDLLVRFDGRIISLDPRVMTRWGELTAKVESSGVDFPAVDAMVAAIVLTHEMVLVTLYEDDFKNTGIEIINPW